MQYVCTRLLPFLRRAAATKPFPDTRQRRGAAPETALSSAVSSQAQRHQVWCKTPRATGSPPPTPPTLKTIRADVRDEAKSRAGSPLLLPPSHDKQPGSDPPRAATHRDVHARPTPRSAMTSDASPGCCDASPWLSWNWWWEPIHTLSRRRSQAEQEMIEACTTPRSGRTSFDE